MALKEGNERQRQFAGTRTEISAGAHKIFAARCAITPDDLLIAVQCSDPAHQCYQPDVPAGLTVAVGMLGVMHLRWGDAVAFARWVLEHAPS